MTTCGGIGRLSEAGASKSPKQKGSKNLLIRYSDPPNLHDSVSNHRTSEGTIGSLGKHKGMSGTKAAIEDEGRSYIQLPAEP